MFAESLFQILQCIREEAVVKLGNILNFHSKLLMKILKGEGGVVS